MPGGHQFLGVTRFSDTGLHRKKEKKKEVEVAIDCEIEIAERPTILASYCPVSIT